MSTNAKIAELLAMAADLEKVAEAEAVASAAKTAYREDPTEENRAAHRAASQALNEARSASRAGDRPRVVDPNSLSITPATVNAGSNANNATVQES